MLLMLGTPGIHDLCHEKTCHRDFQLTVVVINQPAHAATEA